jgi:hypothetical protein
VSFPRFAKRDPTFVGLVMRSLPVAALVALLVPGCVVPPPAADSTWPTVHVLYDNPALLPVSDHQYVWEAVVDVVA